MTTEGADVRTAWPQVELDDDLQTVNDQFYERQWTDGLPIVPPTPERVAAMLRYTDLPADAVLGEMGPAWRPATVHHIAVNAVMAGCRPEYLPVLVAGVRAAVDPAVNVAGAQATTNPTGVMLLVNGPIARELDINAGFNVLGQGWRANMTIGRAMRLCLINIGGGIPGKSDMAPHGNPNKFGSCIAENEAESPWEPFHVERGFEAGTSTVTAMATIGPQNVIALSADAEAVLGEIARGLQAEGSNIMHFKQESIVALSPVHARHVAAGGFGKDAVRRFLWERGRIRLHELSTADEYALHRWKDTCIVDEDGAAVMYPAERPEDLAVIVAGGPVGPHSVILPAFNSTRLVTKPIATADGTSLTSVHDLR